MEYVTTYAPIALAVLGAFITALAVIAPLTKNDTDNKVLSFLQKVQAFVAKVISPSTAPAAKAK